MKSNSEDTLNKSIADFKRTVEITRDVRFQANLRLASRQRLSSYVISLLSLYVIAVSLLPNIINLTQQQNQILLSCSIILSVFVIFTSIIDGSQNFFHQGELLHRCARKIATVHHKLKIIESIEDLSERKNELIKLQEDYRSALDECSVNHANCDFYDEIARKPWLFPQDYGEKAHDFKRMIFWMKARFGEHSWLSGHLIALGTISAIVFIQIFR
jgi:hypothetical protein